MTVSERTERKAITSLTVPDLVVVALMFSFAMLGAAFKREWSSKTKSRSVLTLARYDCGCWILLLGCDVVRLDCRLSGCE